jgi:hypothetical protein
MGAVDIMDTITLILEALICAIYIIIFYLISASLVMLIKNLFNDTSKNNNDSQEQISRAKWVLPTVFLSVSEVIWVFVGYMIVHIVLNY